MRHSHNFGCRVVRLAAVDAGEAEGGSSKLSVSCITSSTKGFMPAYSVLNCLMGMERSVGEI